MKITITSAALSVLAFAGALSPANAANQVYAKYPIYDFGCTDPNWEDAFKDIANDILGGMRRRLGESHDAQRKLPPSNYCPYSLPYFCTVYGGGRRLEEVPEERKLQAACSTQNATDWEDSRLVNCNKSKMLFTSCTGPTTGVCSGANWSLRQKLDCCDENPTDDQCDPQDPNFDIVCGSGNRNQNARCCRMFPNDTFCPYCDSTINNEERRNMRAECCANVDQDPCVEGCQYCLPGDTSGDCASPFTTSLPSC